MKKNRIFGIAAVAAMLLTSCSEEQTWFNIDNVPGRATISGDIVYQAGTTLQNGQFVYDVKPASDVEVFVTVANSGYDEKLSGESTFTTRTDASGHYSIEVPTGNGTVNATIRTADFAGTLTTVERQNNKLVSVESPVVRWAQMNLSLSDHGIYYGNMTCSHRNPQVLPESYSKHAEIHGTFNCNVERMTPIEPIYNTTNTLIGYRDASVSYEWTACPYVDLLVTVKYPDLETPVTYNCTTNSAGDFSLDVPVKEFPASFSFNVTAISKTGTFVTYEPTEELRYVNGVSRTYRSYIDRKLNGYYLMKNNNGNNYDVTFELFSTAYWYEINNFVFVPYTEDQDIYNYNQNNW